MLTSFFIAGKSFSYFLVINNSFSEIILITQIQTEVKVFGEEIQLKQLQETPGKVFFQFV